MTFYNKYKIKSCFQRWGYPEDVINTEMKKVLFTETFCKPINKNKSLPFVLTCHLLLKKVNCIIRKHRDAYMNEEVKKTKRK